jgi:hypothetical protein
MATDSHDALHAAPVTFQHLIMMNSLLRDCQEFYWNKLFFKLFGYYFSRASNKK